MLQKPHGNLQIKRTCVAFHKALRFLSPPDLNSTPWDTPKVGEKGLQSPISQRVGVQLRPHAARWDHVTPRRPHAAGPRGGHRPGVTVWGPSGQTGRPGTWQVSVRLETDSNADERGSATGQAARRPVQNFLCNLNQFPELAGRPRGHRKQGREGVPDTGRQGLPPGRKSPLRVCPRAGVPPVPARPRPAGFGRAHFGARPGGRAGEDPPAPHLAGSTPPARPPRRPGTRDGTRLPREGLGRARQRARAQPPGGGRGGGAARTRGARPNSPPTSKVASEAAPRTWPRGGRAARAPGPLSLRPAPTYPRRGPGCSRARAAAAAAAAEAGAAPPPCCPEPDGPAPRSLGLHGAAAAAPRAAPGACRLPPRAPRTRTTGEEAGGAGAEAAPRLRPPPPPPPPPPSRAPRAGRALQRAPPGAGPRRGGRRARSPRLCPGPRPPGAGRRGSAGARGRAPGLHPAGLGG